MALSVDVATLDAYVGKNGVGIKGSMCDSAGFRFKFGFQPHSGRVFTDGIEAGRKYGLLMLKAVEKAKDDVQALFKDMGGEGSAFAHVK